LPDLYQEPADSSAGSFYFKLNLPKKAPKIEPMLKQIKRRLKNYKKKGAFSDHLKPASVLIPAYEKDGVLYLLFTRRTDNVEHHKGQISFPGGMRDDGDADAAATALRETHEELGIAPEGIRILGELDDHVTVSGFNVTPIVGEISYPFALNICKEELSEVFSVPLEFLMKPSHCTTDFLLDEDGHKREFYVFQYGAYKIWGVTAGITRNFIDVIG